MAPSLPRSFAGRHKETVITIMFIPEETVVREKMLRWCQLVPLLVELDMRRVIPPRHSAILDFRKQLLFPLLTRLLYLEIYCW